MILEEHLLNKVKAFCKEAGITIHQGESIASKDIPLIREIISKIQTSERIATRREEQDNGMKIDTILRNIIPKYTPMESPIEEYLYDALCNAGLKDILELQYKVGTKRVDIAIPSLKIAIEADGKAYHHTEQRQIDDDLARDKYLARKGWRVLHIEGVAIRRDIKLCVEKVKEIIGK